MEPYVMFLCLLASASYVESGRIKRQDFGDYTDYQDFGLAFITVDGKPFSAEQFQGNNHLQGGRRYQNNGFDNGNFQNRGFDNVNFQNGGFDHSQFSNPPPPKPKKKEANKIPGRPGVDYPTYHQVPETSFRCSDTPAIPGMYANVETGCQAYHICQDGRDGPQGASFLCTNGTLFNQKEFTCDWWYNVDCGLSLLYYGLNLDPLRNPYTKREKEEELRKFHEFNQYNQQH